MIYLIDTSVWLDFLNKRNDFSHIKELRKFLNDRKAVWCPMVQLELQRTGKNRESALALFSEVLPSLEITQSVWKLAYAIGLKCSKKGRPVPNSDVLIYATAFHHNCTVFHNDKHFDWLAEIFPQKSEIQT